MLCIPLSTRHPTQARQSVTCMRGMASAELARSTAKGPTTVTCAADELQVMFPALEREVIESALRQHCGAMEATVDYLVALTQGDTARLMQPTPSDHLGGPARYTAATQLDTPPHVGRGDHSAAFHRSFSGPTGKPGSKYSRRQVGSQKAAVSSDGLEDLHFEQLEEGE